MMHILNSVNKREYESPDYQKKLVYAKAIEIREEYQKKAVSELLHILSESEKDVETGNIVPMQDTIDELKQLLSMRDYNN